MLSFQCAFLFGFNMETATGTNWISPLFDLTQNPKLETVGQWLSVGSQAWKDVILTQWILKSMLQRCYFQSVTLTLFCSPKALLNQMYCITCFAVLPSSDSLKHFGNTSTFHNIYLLDADAPPPAPISARYHQVRLKRSPAPGGHDWWCWMLSSSTYSLWKLHTMTLFIKTNLQLNK